MREVKAIKRLLCNGNVLFSMKYSLQAHITDSVPSLGNFRPGRRKRCQNKKPFEIFKKDVNRWSNLFFHNASLNISVSRWWWTKKGGRSRGLSGGCAQWSRGRRAGLRWPAAATRPTVAPHRLRPARRPGKESRIVSIWLDQDEHFLSLIAQGNGEKNIESVNTVCVCVHACLRACVWNPPQLYNSCSARKQKRTSFGAGMRKRNSQADGRLTGTSLTSLMCPILLLCTVIKIRQI